MIDDLERRITRQWTLKLLRNKKKVHFIEEIAKPSRKVKILVGHFKIFPRIKTKIVKRQPLSILRSIPNHRSINNLFQRKTLWISSRSELMVPALHIQEIVKILQNSGICVGKYTRNTSEEYRKIIFKRRLKTLIDLENHLKK